MQLERHTICARAARSHETFLIKQQIRKTKTNQQDNFSSIYNFNENLANLVCNAKTKDTKKSKRIQNSSFLILSELKLN